MLELRPSCENCNKLLPPNAQDAMIYSYECTFCKHYVAHILFNVCPNCGVGFSCRPVRPQYNHKGGNYLGNDPATTKVTYKPVDRQAHGQFSQSLRNIDPDKR